MNDMRVNIAGVELKNPVITASGTFGFAEEYGLHMDVAKLGAFTLKALTRESRPGNPPVRIAETASGALNSVGLQNPGVDEFLRTIYPRIRKIDTVKIANIAGACVEDYVYVAEKLNDTDIELYEVNVSCPNVKHGGVNFGTDARTLRGVVEEVKKAVSYTHLDVYKRQAGAYAPADRRENEVLRSAAGLFQKGAAIFTE